MDWLITGGAGQLGLAISRELKLRGISFSALNSTQLDVTNVDSISSSLSEFRPRVIVNCAAWTDVDGAEAHEEEAFRVNAIGAENIALAAKECGAKLIHISTDYVFSGKASIPWKVDDKRDPQTAYGRTKLAGEKKVLSIYSENTLLIRTAWLYSPWKKNFLKTVLQLSKKNTERISMVNDQIGQPTSAVDLAVKIIELVESPNKMGIFHGTNTGEASWFDFAAEILRLNNESTTRLIPISTSDFKSIANRPVYSVLDQTNWHDSGIKPMRDWKAALGSTMNILKMEIERGKKHA